MANRELENREFVFYYESRQNPNGDPGFENQPRLMPDDTILVTDVRLKRTIRDYARDLKGERIFVDYDEKGNAITADKSAERIIGSLKNTDVIKELTKKTFDVPLFGALVTVRPPEGSEESGEGGSFKLTGPVQFGIARSVNKVKVINPSITSHFLGRLKNRSQGSEEEQTHGTIGKFYSVEYALIKAYGAVAPRNLGKYLKDNEVVNRFNSVESQLFECLWNGTDQLVSRSKYPQRSVFFLEVSYASKLYNDLHLLIDESDEMKGWATSLRPSPFSFAKLLDVLESRKQVVERIRVAHCADLLEDAHKLVDDLKSRGLKAEDILCSR